LLTISLVISSLVWFQRSDQWMADRI
jgi:hypothetical protein